MRYVRNNKTGVVFAATPELLKQAAQLDLDVLDDAESDAYEAALGIAAPPVPAAATADDGDGAVDDEQAAADVAELPAGGTSAEALAAALAAAPVSAVPAADVPAVKPAPGKATRRAGA